MGKEYLERDNVNWKKDDQENSHHIKGFLKEEKFTFQRKIQELVTWHKISKEIIIDFDQTPLPYTTVGNTTLEFFGAQSVPKRKRKTNHWHVYYYYS